MFSFLEAKDFLLLALFHFLVYPGSLIKDGVIDFQELRLRQSKWTFRRTEHCLCEVSTVEMNYVRLHDKAQDKNLLLELNPAFLVQHGDS